MDKNNFIMSYSVDKSFDSDKFLKIRCRVCHDQESPNHTFFTKETMEKANSESLEYIPVLAHVYENDEGKPVIGSHDMHIEDDKLNEGESRLIFDETPIGMVPSLADNNCTIEEYNGLNYTYVDAYIWRDYSNYAEQLVEDAENTKLSMEIDFPSDALSYDAKNNRYNISSYRYRGITLLNESLGTGMKDAQATTKFSADDDVRSKMIVLMEELKKCLYNYDKTNTTQKGGNEMKFEELLAKYGKTAEEVTFEIEGLSDEELEAKFAEVFDCGSDDGDANGGTNIDGDEGNNGADDSGTCGDDDGAGDDGNDGGGDGDPEQQPEEKFVLKYELSHDDVRSALYNLLAATNDDGYYYTWIVEVYDNKFIYQDYQENKFYRQGYTKDGDIVALDDNKVEVFNEWLSKDEREALDTLKAKYDELNKFKEDAEAAALQAKKDAVFADEKYSNVVNTKAFQKLIENSKDYSVEECAKKADEILDDFSSFAVNFAANTDVKPQKTIGLNFNAKPSKKKAAYGGLFEKDE